METNMLTRYFSIRANGQLMGHYPGQDEHAAADFYAADQGYEDLDDLLDRVPGSSRSELDVDDVTDDLAESAASQIGAVDYGDVWAIPVDSDVLVVTACEMALLGDLLRNNPINEVSQEWLGAVSPRRVRSIAVGLTLLRAGVSDLDAARTCAAQARDIDTVLALDLQRPVVASVALPA